MSHREQGDILASHIHAMRERFIAETGKPPKILALGRWDCRELAHWCAGRLNNVTPRQFLASARGGATVYEVAKVRVDGRVGRMPGGLWWHADRRH